MCRRRLAARPRAGLIVFLALVAGGLPGLSSGGRPALAATAASFGPVADATVIAGDPEANFGGALSLDSDGSPKKESYLRFSVSGLTGPVERAELRLFVVNPAGNGPEAYGAATNWNEAEVTWASRPSRIGKAADDVGSVKEGKWVEYDVSALVAGNGPVAFGLIPDSSTGAGFASREAKSNRPQLVVETGDVETVVLTPRADARVQEDEPEENFGSSSLGVQGEPEPEVESYLRFVASDLAGTVHRATLRLFVTGGGEDGPAVHSTEDGWSEDEITWENRPGPDGPAVDDLEAVEDDTWIELDVTPILQGDGPWDLVLVGGTGGSVWMRSREAAAEERPQLVIETSIVPPPRECRNDWGTARKVGELVHGMAEMSGLAASGRERGWAWGIRDSGNPAALYSFRIGSGTMTPEVFPVPGTSNSDWEDLAWTPGPGGTGVLWILENVGNGHGGNRRIYQVAEPDPTSPGPAVLLGRYDWAYPDAQHNTEVIFVFEGDLVVVSKTSPSRVYRFEDGLQPNTVNRPVFVGTLPEGSNLSVGSVSPDQRFLAVASHSKVYVYENRDDLDDLGDLIADPPVFRQSMPSDNREGGGFFPSGSCDIVLVAESKNIWRLENE